MKSQFFLGQKFNLLKRYILYTIPSLFMVDRSVVKCLSLMSGPQWLNLNKCSGSTFACLIAWYDNSLASHPLSLTTFLVHLLNVWDYIALWGLWKDMNRRFMSFVKFSEIDRNCCKQRAMHIFSACSKTVRYC